MQGRLSFLSLMMLVLAAVGCRSVPAVQSMEGPPATANTAPTDQPLPQQSEPVPDEEIALAAHENAESGLDNPDGESALTLADLESIALSNNPTLDMATARVNAAAGKQVQAGLYPNPVIGYHATEIGNLDTAGQQGGFVSQRFITGGKLKLDQAIAGKEFEERYARLSAQQQRVLSDVRVRYYEALVAQRRVQQTTELAGIGDALVEATDKLLKGRLSTENDLLQAQIKADESHILLDNARNQSTAAWRRLAAVIGQPDKSEARLMGELDNELPRLDWDGCYATVLDNHPELNAARARVDRSSFAIRRAEREPIPNVDLWVSARHHNVTGYEVANVRLGIPIPIFDKNQGNIQAAESEWIAACNDVKRIELGLQDRLAVAFRRYENARQQTERYSRQIIPRAERSLNLVRDGYDKGQVEYLTLLTAQQTYLRVNLSFLDSLQELWAASAVIRGQLLTDSLNTNN